MLIRWEGVLGLLLSYPILSTAFTLPPEQRRPAFFTSPSGIAHGKTRLSRLGAVQVIEPRERSFVVPSGVELELDAAEQISSSVNSNEHLLGEPFLDASGVSSPITTLKTFSVVFLDQWRNEALSTKCPFTRQRKLDFISGIESIVRASIFTLEYSNKISKTLNVQGKDWIMMRSNGNDSGVEDVVSKIRNDWTERFTRLTSDIKPVLVDSSFSKNERDTTQKISNLSHSTLKSPAVEQTASSMHSKVHEVLQESGGRVRVEDVASATRAERKAGMKSAPSRVAEAKTHRVPPMPKLEVTKKYQREKPSHLLPPAAKSLSSKQHASSVGSKRKSKKNVIAKKGMQSKLEATKTYRSETTSFLLPPFPKTLEAEQSSPLAHSTKDFKEILIEDKGMHVIDVVGATRTDWKENFVRFAGYASDSKPAPVVLPTAKTQREVPMSKLEVTKNYQRKNSSKPFLPAAKPLELEQSTSSAHSKKSFKEILIESKGEHFIDVVGVTRTHWKDNFARFAGYASDSKPALVALSSAKTQRDGPISSFGVAKKYEHEEASEHSCPAMKSLVSAQEVFLEHSKKNFKDMLMSSQNMGIQDVVGVPGRDWKDNFSHFAGFASGIEPGPTNEPVAAASSSTRRNPQLSPWKDNFAHAAGFASGAKPAFVTSSNHRKAPVSPFGVNKVHQREEERVLSPSALKAVAAAAAIALEQYPSSVNSEKSIFPRDVDLEQLPLSALKHFYVEYLEKWYIEALSVKCPFFRRRRLDFIEGIENVVRASIERLGGEVGAQLSCRGNEDTWMKNKGMEVEDVVSMIRNDWEEETGRSYYVTGKLNTTIYRDDCFFDGPDPDMPVKGLVKYAQVASQLFDSSHSTCKLLSLKVGEKIGEHTTIHANWRMNAIMRLPWKPRLPEVVGSTTYYLDKDNLIYKHTETWDVSVGEAFSSILPSFSAIF